MIHLACECVRQWWLNYGQIEYPDSKKLLLLCGGSSSLLYFQRGFTKIIQWFRYWNSYCYPPYTSKYNPIEYRLFSHITRACKGVIFKTIEIANNLIAKTSTSKGLKVFSSILEKTFEIGRKYTDGFKENLKISFDDFLPKWNYVAVPT